jgi:hypothetical protein
VRRLEKREGKKRGTHTHTRKRTWDTYGSLSVIYLHTNANPRLLMQGKKEARLSLFHFSKDPCVCVLSLSLYRVGLLHKDREAEKITFEFV